MHLVERKYQWCALLSTVIKLLINKRLVITSSLSYTLLLSEQDLVHLLALAFRRIRIVRIVINYVLE
jgi:hypothetical protein